jgi:Phage portal protein
VPRLFRRAARAEPVPGNVRLGRLIQEAIDRRNGIGDLDIFELPIVVTCRDMIANTIGQLPLINYRAGRPTGDQPPIAVRPDPTETRRDTMVRLVNQLTGPGFCWVIPTAWYVDGVTPAAVRVVDGAEAAGIWSPRHELVDVVWNGEHYDPALGEVHLIRYRITDSGAPADCGPLGACRQAITWLAALWQMAGSFWEAGFPSIALVVEQALSTPQKTEAKQAMMAAFARRHEPAVIDRGGSLQPVGVNALEAQLVESINMANAEVARVMQMMPSLVNVIAQGSLTYTTTEGELRKWLALGLGAFMTPIEACWSDLRPGGQQCRFDSSELLRTDLAGRYSAYSVALGRWLTVEEVRAAEGLDWPPPSPLDAKALTVSPFADPIPTGALTP